MNRLIWRTGVAGGLLLVLVAGCNDPMRGLPVGGIIEKDEVDRPDSAELEGPRPQEAGLPVADSDRHESRWDFPDRDRESDSRDAMPSRSESWDTDRPMPSDSMPSRSDSWGKDRRMPSDSMPSRSDTWGGGREMPSDSMPSRSESWGKDRRMPSDSMPSRSFPRR